jgi:hypothetical protein
MEIPRDGGVLINQIDKASALAKQQSRNDFKAALFVGAELPASEPS